MRDFKNETGIPARHGERDTRAAVLRGWRRRCPNCGAGPLMIGYLKIQDHCAVCGEDLHHHRADDGPAWATILIAGHILAPLMIAIYVAWRPQAWEMAVGFSLLFTVLALYLLPRLKGMFVGFQWARRMHGFAGAA
ncbi:DUF983 domain-containing protein [Rhodobacteraceae bacterium 2CG4]|uniref:DUF983 domain-containing protein n=1 Tax=Halovulum marinum TaxID=2662447 RepID=A0A6L5YVM8_9RHOB|nr:DUF983 domain-containing protein [Halovulum marinum]MSU88297.1 DUF983 domain-containing protein [Halovulum marinum]